MDGTLCDVRGIRHYVTGKVRNFHAFHQESVNCPPNANVVEATHAAHDAGLKVIIVTARDEMFDSVTSWWLLLNKVYFDDMFMRKHKDSRPDYVIKKELLSKIRRQYNPIHAWDDNPNVIRLWNEEGIPTTIVQGYGFESY